MANASTTTTLDVVGTADIFPAEPASAPRTQLMKLAQFIKGLAGGARVGTSIIQHGHMVAGTATITPAATGANAADTFTLNGTVFTAEQEMARGTVTCASVSEADTVTVQGEVFTAVNGTPDPDAGEFDMSGADSATAASLVAALAANATVSAIITASAPAAIVKLRSILAGTGGNAYTLDTSNNSRLAKSGTTLLLGAAVAANKFDYGDTQAQTAAEVARTVNASTSVPVAGIVTAAATSTVATITAVRAGKSGRAGSLTSSNGGRLAVGALPFQNATEDGPVTYTLR